MSDGVQASSEAQGQWEATIADANAKKAELEEAVQATLASLTAHLATVSASHANWTASFRLLQEAAAKQLNSVKAQTDEALEHKRTAEAEVAALTATTNQLKAEKAELEGSLEKLKSRDKSSGSKLHKSSGSKLHTSKSKRDSRSVSTADVSLSKSRRESRSASVAPGDGLPRDHRSASISEKSHRTRSARQSSHRDREKALVPILPSAEDANFRKLIMDLKTREDAILAQLQTPDTAHITCSGPYAHLLRGLDLQEQLRSLVVPAHKVHIPPAAAAYMQQRLAEWGRAAAAAPPDDNGQPPAADTTQADLAAASSPLPEGA